jgi:hypothetical protein
MLNFQEKKNFSKQSARKKSLKKGDSPKLTQ